MEFSRANIIPQIIFVNPISKGFLIIFFRTKILINSRGRHILLKYSLVFTPFQIPNISAKVRKYLPLLPTSSLPSKFPKEASQNVIWTFQLESLTGKVKVKWKTQFGN